MKLGRRCQLSVEINPSPTAGTDFSEGRNNVVIPPELTVEFEITRQSLSSSQEARFRIYGLSDRTRQLLWKDPYALTEYRAVQFRAGYADDPFLPLCFNGFVRSCSSYRNTVENVTELSAYDGGLQMSNAFTSQSIASGASVRDTLLRLAASLPRVVSAPLIGQFPNVNTRGKVLFGPTWNIIVEESQGLATFDNGGVKILNYNEAIAAEIPVISAASGLLGTPRRSQSKIDFDIIFEPRMTLGQVIEVRSEFNRLLNGTYKVVGFTHRGIISPAVGGSCTTSVGLFFGTGEFNIVQASLSK